MNELFENTNKDAKVYIAVAGFLGVIASGVTQSVIGALVDSKLGAVDIFLTIFLNLLGVPVPTVGMNNGKDTSYLTTCILNMIT